MKVSKIKNIVENTVREYHTGQQLMLPFDDRTETYNYMQFMEWVQDNSRPGTLPKQVDAFKNVLTDDDEMYLAGIASFSYGLGGEINEEDYYAFLTNMVDTYGNGLIKNPYTVDDVMDEITCVEDTYYRFLTPKGQIVWKELMCQKGVSTVRDFAEYHFKMNDNGLIYCERMIGIENAMGRYKTDNGDYYEELSRLYDGTGVFWSYASGGGYMYCNDRYNQDEVLFRGWVSPYDVDWGTTIELEQADEAELRLSGDAKIQLDSIILKTRDENGRYVVVDLLKNKGSVLINA